MTLEQVIRGIDDRLPKWRLWFPDEDSAVEIPRRDLLLLVAAARRTLPPRPAWADRPRVAENDPAFAPLATLPERMELRVGDVVAVRMDLGEVCEFVVRHPAWQMPGDVWVIGLGDMPGGFLLERVVGRKVA